MATQLDKQQILTFLRKAGEDIKRTGEELRTEGKRLVDEMRDPANQHRVREGLHELSGWLKRTTQEAADVIEGAVRKAETTLRAKVKVKAKPARRTAAKRSTAKKSGKKSGAKPGGARKK